MTVSVLAVIALMAVAGCGSDVTVEAETTTTAAPPSSEETTTVAPTTSVAPESSDAEAPAPEGDLPKCTASSITPSLGAPAKPTSEGQVVLQLSYENTGTAPCSIYGLPGATLKGPDVETFGPEYQLARSDQTEQTTIRLEPGAAAVADMTLLIEEGGWQADELLTIAPGDTEVMTVPFPGDLPLLRQDGATRPGTYVEAFTGPAS